ncbi:MULTISPECIES: glycerol-3-phosphate dehydrogenase subunit GlpB [unclassified Haladaptatus]|uniref:glycerol-3-phosphate dehydrogenase subunit GlpB n=1 Tax=unclassified Haladaptatus TaxID=2622732 RepID=UPI0023E88114|nr:MULTISPECIES: glycerol-3-phosphate dehydrogenase subunit GlpB [unclassified Haladaptatus]
MIESDVLVVGGGLAGGTAALSAAREGADVRLVSHKESTLRHASGLIDVLGYHDGTLLADPFSAVGDMPEGHPYERVGSAAVEAGLDLFDEVAGDLYAGSHTTKNALVPTHGGTVKPTARYPASVAPGLASDDGEMLLVGFETLTDFDAPLAADHLQNAGVPFEVRGVTARFPMLRADAKITRYAKVLDTDEKGIRSQLVEAIEPHLGDATRVGFPAVLGHDHPARVREALADALGADVFEVPSGPPSLPGMRLEDVLFAALREAGVTIETGNPVVGFEASDGRIDHVAVKRTHQRVPYFADEFVLATGGLVGKGITTSREGVREPVFDLHVPHPENRYDWFEDEAFGDHPFARFGVAVDTDLRPLDGSGAVEYANLRAAGGVLGGADFAAEKSGSGISLATGRVAGRRAAQS